MLKIFNTLTKKKELFKPIALNTVKMYICGATVYDMCHIGHARTFVIFDTIVRYLSYQGYNVKYVRNITDIDDKIIARANSNNETIYQLTNRIIKSMHLDLYALNVLRPTHEPRVTDYIDTIIDFIELLVKKKYAYTTSSGDVIFSIQTINNYGVLAGRISNNKVIKNKRLCNLISIKQNPDDFVLWKSVKPGEPCWISPWGKGRPGWHIECSAIRHAILGENIDIHGGGADLIFPHHDNDIIQSICAYSNSKINIWMHSGLLFWNSKKMSKSLYNFITVQDLLQKYDSETIRFFLLSAHYRSLLKYSGDNLKKSRLSLERLYIALRDINLSVTPHGGEYFISKFIDKMNDDFNTPEAYSVLFEIGHELNILKKQKKILKAQGIAATLKYLANTLGVLYFDPDTYLKASISLKKVKVFLEFDEIQELIQSREKARYNGQWKIADEIRMKLKIMGIILEDEPDGKTKWRCYF